MKKLGIFLGPCCLGFWDEKNLETGGVGGSETWAIQLSSEFIKKGYDVTLFGNPEFSHISNDGVKYEKYQNFIVKQNEEKYDYIITSRRVDFITDEIKCDNIYLMCHDTIVIGCETKEDLKLNRIKGIAYQSEFQKYMLIKKYGIPDNKFFKTSEGILIDRYDKLGDLPKKNKMLMCSGTGRGTEWLIKEVFPLIRRQVPDFIMNICGYFDSFNEPWYKQDGINLLGCISKDSVIKEQKESKIWIYPNHGYQSDGGINAETFSITAIENAAAKCACILSDWGCFYSTLKGYNGFVGNGLFQNIFKPMDKKLMPFFAVELANDAIKCLTNEEYRIKKVESSYNVAKKYTWEYAADSFEKQWS